MIIPDANLLLYATDAGSPFHAPAFKWWSECLHGDETVGFCHPAIFAFVRLSTHPRVFLHPLSVEQAFAYVKNWSAFPSVEWLQPDEQHSERVETLLREAGTGGNLVTDAQIAAYALQYKGRVYSADLDFNRFHDLKFKNPLA